MKLRDLLNGFWTFFVMILTAMFAAAVVLISMYAVKSFAQFLFPESEWFSKAVESIAHLMAVVIFIISSLRDLTRYFKNK